MEQSLEINRKSANYWVIRGFCVALAAGFWTLAALPAVAQKTPETAASSSAKKPTKPSHETKKKDKASKPVVALGRFRDQEILESSGIVNAQPAEGQGSSSAIWTFNDSGGAPILYLVSHAGHTIAKLKLKGSRNKDWETMCRFGLSGKSWLAVGDVGDNSFNRKTSQIYIVEEPLVKEFNAPTEPIQLSAKAEKIEFQFEDGPHNCEAMSYCSEDDTFWFVEKVYVDDGRKTPPGIYVMKNPMAHEGTSKTAVRVADFPYRNITGMAFSPNGKRLVIRSYFGAWMFEKDAGATWVETVKNAEPKTIALPLQSQGEAICFTPDSNSLLVTSEMANAIIWQVNFSLKAERE